MYFIVYDKTFLPSISLLATGFFYSQKVRKAGNLCTVTFGQIPELGAHQNACCALISSMETL